MTLLVGADPAGYPAVPPLYLGQDNPHTCPDPRKPGRTSSSPGGCTSRARWPTGRLLVEL